ncbi:hypothetical protein PsorP6_005820 [Peronosclerospora sorghi]|uniref:Uncharacterized protein n=1 Tax=Peronosclerospora sorghi TaxID=230839 RepID=A0ACC0W1Q6_9STRA|nr:hypothetical protein PsorP6_005820 [Peronosclerospora sorghi]
MVSRGVNGATSGTLNERFIKCVGCNVNVPKEDMLSLGKCTICGRPYEPVATEDGREEIATVGFDDTVATAEQKTKRKRWAVLTSKRGRTYYHNTETGEDRWDKPSDLDADAAEDAFVPFKNDAVKNAVLREQMKLEATKMGVPMEVVAATQYQLRQQDEVDDPIANIVGHGRKETERKSTLVDPAGSKMNGTVSLHAEKNNDEAKEDRHGSEEGSCLLM